MKPTPTHHLIFVRPPGSWTWTVHMTERGTPWRDGRADVANREACHIVEHTELCAIVVPVALPQEQDTEQYALMADGQTLYRPTEPVRDEAADTRAAFEAFVQARSSGNADLTRDGDSYRHPLVANAWAVWKAAMLHKTKQL